MYIGYVDESGYVGSSRNVNQPVQTMACILPNAYNLHRTYDDFGTIMDILNDNNIAISELKAEEIYRGRRAWNRVEGEIRHDIFSEYLNWLVERKHKIILSLIDNNKFFDLKDSEDELADFFNVPYVAAAMHIALSTQKYNQCSQRSTKNKGKTILIFDDQDEFKNKVEELVYKPPEFTDDFYGYQSRHGIRLNQIIDTAFFVKSHYSNLIQVADTVAFVSRLYLELTEYDMRESYSGELNRIQTWFDMIKARLIPSSHCYPRGSQGIIMFFRNIAPSSVPF